MTTEFPDQLDEQMRRFEGRLPPKWSSRMRWLRQPSSRAVRIPVAGALVVGGVFSFLPVLGLWMLPVGVVLMAQDVKPLRKPTAKMLAFIDRKWPARTKGGPPEPQR